MSTGWSARDERPPPVARRTLGRNGTRDPRDHTTAVVAVAPRRDGTTGLRSRTRRWSDGSFRIPAPRARSVAVRAVASREAITWRVRIWTTSGASSWSDRVSFETGLLEPADWQARWIEPHEPGRLPSGERPAYVLRHEFEVDDGHDGTERPARLYATAPWHLRDVPQWSTRRRPRADPGLHDLPRTLQVQTYDVTDLLSHGTNHWTVLLSDGWFRGRHGIDQHADNYGTTVAFLGQISVGPSTVATGPDWISTTGPIRHADLMAGQYEDHRVDDGPWNPVGIVEHDLGVLTSSPAPPVRRIETIRPRSVTRLSPTRQVVDLGQNITGWMHLSDLGPADTDITLVHAEALDPSGDITLDHLGVGDRPVRQIDRVISAGIDGDTFEPRHTIHGFQYVQVEGPHRSPPTTSPASSCTPTCGAPGGSAAATIASTGCTRSPTGASATTPATYRRTVPIVSVRVGPATGRSSCRVRHFSTTSPGSRSSGSGPSPPSNSPTGSCRTTYRTRGGARRSRPTTSPGTGCSVRPAGAMPACSCPGSCTALYGDRAILDEMWPTMDALAGLRRRAARTKRHPARAAARPDATAPTRSSSGTAGGTGVSGASRSPTPPSPGTPSTRDMWRRRTCTARRRSPPRSADVARSLRRRRGLRPPGGTALDAWRGEYLADDGSLTPDTQANHVRALAFGLVPDELRAALRRTARATHPRGRHPSRHGLPRDADAAARARRPRASRRGVRVAAAGHRTVVADDGRPGRQHRVGGVGRHRRPTASPTNRSTTTARVPSSRSSIATSRASDPTRR